MMDMVYLILGIFFVGPLLFLAVAFTQAAREMSLEIRKWPIAFLILFAGTVLSWTGLMMLLKFCFVGLFG
jgi:hypothetical protein